MSSVFTWLQTNWLQIVAILLIVDRLLVQLFPTNTLFQGILNILQSLGGSPAPAPTASAPQTVVPLAKK